MNRWLGVRNASSTSLGVAFKTYEKDIQELNAGIHDYIRAVSDRPKRAAEFDEAIQLAEAEWKEVWRKRPSPMLRN